MPVWNPVRNVGVESTPRSLPLPQQIAVPHAEATHGPIAVETGGLMSSKRPMLPPLLRLPWYRLQWWVPRSLKDGPPWAVSSMAIPECSIRRSRIQLETLFRTVSQRPIKQTRHTLVCNTAKNVGLAVSPRGPTLDSPTIASAMCRVLVTAQRCAVVRTVSMYFKTTPW